jgi:hypothetical protein
MRSGVLLARENFRSSNWPDRRYLAACRVSLEERISAARRRRSKEKNGFITFL